MVTLLCLGKVGDEGLKPKSVCPEMYSRFKVYFREYVGAPGFAVIGLYLTTIHRTQCLFFHHLSALILFLTV